MTALVPFSHGRPAVVRIGSCVVYISVHDAWYADQKRAWKWRMAQAHPDAGGMAKDFCRLQRHYERWLQGEKAWYAAYELPPPHYGGSAGPPPLIRPVREPRVREPRVLAQRRERPGIRSSPTLLRTIEALRTSTTLDEAAATLGITVKALRGRMDGVNFKRSTFAREDYIRPRRRRRRQRLGVRQETVMALRQASTLPMAATRLGLTYQGLWTRMQRWQIDKGELGAESFAARRRASKVA
jgi:hypothetical protein